MGVLMTLADVARLAHVRRPVVTTWRRRHARSARPFPPAHSGPHGQEMFDSDEVVAWLEDTERGNNPDARADAAAHVLIEGAQPDSPRVTAEALSALLTLRHLLGRPLAGLGADDLLDLADAADPDDAVVFHELEVAPDLRALAAWSEQLVEAAWNEVSAHDGLLDQRFRLHWRLLAEATVSDVARRLLSALCAALCRALGPTATLMDPTGEAADLLPAAAVAAGVPISIVARETAMGRLLRRRLVLADASVDTVARDGGQWAVTGRVVQLVQLQADRTPEALLGLIDEVRLQMDAQQVGVILGPSAVLVDALEAGQARGQRDALLREGVVRAIVRLPAGLRPARPQEHLALWLLAEPGSGDRSERRTSVADLSSVALTPRACQELVDDLLAVHAGAEGVRRRAWRFLTHVPTSELVATNGALTAWRRPVREPSAHGADWVVALRRADEECGALAGLVLRPASGSPEEVSLPDAVERGWLRVEQGHRVDVADLPAGNVRVVCAPAIVAGSLGDLTVDRYALLARADVRTTEPGDVIFVDGARPGAVVDAEGGAVVLFPARVLRVRRPGPLSARQVAAAVRSAAPGSRWRSWTVPGLPPDQAARLDEALTDVDAERSRLVARLARLDALASDLTTAVGSRRITLHTEESDGTPA